MNDRHIDASPSAQGAGAGPMEPQKAFESLSQTLLDNGPLNLVMEKVARLAQQTIPNARQVSVTLLDDKGEAPFTIAFTGDLAVDLDERQYERGFGPCVDAAVTGETITIHDTSASELYTEFSRLCARKGVTTTLSVGLPIPSRSIGAINFYGEVAKGFDQEAIEVARTFAGYAAVALANASLYASATQLAEQMEVAMTSRAVIEQAKGVLMARNGDSADEAFARLTHMSQDSNRKLRDIARDVVDEVQNTISD